MLGMAVSCRSFTVHICQMDKPRVDPLRPVVSSEMLMCSLQHSTYHLMSSHIFAITVVVNIIPPVIIIIKVNPLSHKHNLYQLNGAELQGTRQAKDLDLQAFDISY